MKLNKRRKPMKQKARITSQVLPMPNREDRYMVKMQFVDGGLIITKDNHGTGYHYDTALQIARFAEEHPDVVERNEAQR